GCRIGVDRASDGRELEQLGVRLRAHDGRTCHGRCVHLDSSFGWFGGRARGWGPGLSSLTPSRRRSGSKGRHRCCPTPKALSTGLRDVAPTIEAMTTLDRTPAPTPLMQRLGVDGENVSDGDLVVKTPITGEEIARVTRTSEAETSA